jgi:hypothetical protein
LYLLAFTLALWKLCGPFTVSQNDFSMPSRSTSTPAQDNSLPVPPGAQRKTTARVALFGLPDSAAQIVADCFRQFGIETAVLSEKDASRLHAEKFDACVLPLGPNAGSIIELARTSLSNSRMLIFGVGGTLRDAMLHSKLCVNAVFREPLERSEALKLVRSSRTLVLHEFLRYARIPVMTEVTVAMVDDSPFTATSQEISCGGMSLKGNHVPEPGSQLEVSFSLLTLPRISVRGHVTWRKSDKSFGIRFDASDGRRQRLKEWIAGYLET